MSIRVGFKHIRRNLMRVSTRSYIQLITGFVIAGIFISEGSVKDVSETQNMVVASKPTSSEHVAVSQLSSSSEKTNRTEKEERNTTDTDSAVSSARVSRTLQEILQEAMPEQIFGFSNRERNISEERQIRNSSSLLQDSSMGQLGFNDGAAEKYQHAPVRHFEGNTSSSTQVLTNRTKSQTSLNEAGFIDDSEQNTSKGHRPFKGVLPTEETKLLFETDNVTHLSFMVYRLIKTHNIKSVLDVPCKLSMLWMRELLQILEFEVPKFHYKCLTPDDESLAEGVVRFQHLSSATVLKNSHPWASRLPQADLALCWYGLGFLPPNQSWGLLKALRAAGVKFVLVPNYPEVQHNPGSGSALGRINVRRAPYRFNEPLRVVNNVSTHASTPKQLLFYDMEGIRKDSL